MNPEFESFSKRDHSVCCHHQVTDAQLCQCPQGMLSTSFSLTGDGAQTQPEGKVNCVHLRLFLGSVSGLWVA